MQFHWVTAFGLITGDPQFCQIWGFCWNINKKLVFTLDYYQEKLSTKFFKKSKKTLFWGDVAILAFFAQIWAKMNFPRKNPLSVFKYSNYLPSCKKSEKTNVPFLRKMLKWWMGRQVEGQTDNHNFVGPSLGWGSNY